MKRKQLKIQVRTWADKALFFRYGFTAVNEVLILYCKPVDLVEHVFAKLQASRYPLNHLLRGVPPVFHTSESICRSSVQVLFHMQLLT